MILFTKHSIFSLIPEGFAEECWRRAWPDYEDAELGLAKHFMF